MPLNRLPTWSESGRPSFCERSRISVEPSAPAPMTTMSAATNIAGASKTSRPTSDRLEVDEPAVVTPFDVPHLDLRVDLRAVIPGVGEVVHDQRVLGGVVAAADAVAAQPAGLLVDADVIDAVGVVVDVDRRPVEPLPESVTRRFECGELLELREVLRIGGRAGASRTPGRSRLASRRRRRAAPAARPDRRARAARPAARHPR